ncbi:uncharacterized protein LOC131153682 [Malania oleifera]|uniref:uncharacterized protein LOC131153682 n=1 Tax=Malania oleifera TaxID=397392 RepID=UPI0025AE90EF|nr:uncharacterized protein LOC131153682 [Malania oleifera]
MPSASSFSNSHFSESQTLSQHKKTLRGKGSNPRRGSWHSSSQPLLISDSTLTVSLSQISFSILDSSPFLTPNSPLLSSPLDLVCCSVSDGPDLSSPESPLLCSGSGALQRAGAGPVLSSPLVRWRCYLMGLPMLSLCYPQTQKLRISEEQKLQRMPALWLTLKGSLNCKSKPSDVHDPSGSTKKNNPGKGNGCSKSISNLKGAVHGNRKRTRQRQPPSSSPRSIGSSEIHNPKPNGVVLRNSSSGGEVKQKGLGEGIVSSPVLEGTSRPETPCGCPRARSSRPSLKLDPSYPSTPPRGHSGKEGSSSGGSAVSGGRVDSGDGSGRQSVTRMVAALRTECDASPNLTCQKCGKQLEEFGGIDSHRPSKNAITELVEGESSRRIVEIICRTSWFKSEDITYEWIDRVLKVHNRQNTLDQFEEYREMVKLKASKLATKHPRCLADGNELLRFYGTTIACSLGTNGSSSLCNLENCSVCQILRHGFSAKKESNGVLGVFTTSTCDRAFETIEPLEENQPMRKALMVCRVIAGRVHKPLENFQELDSQSGFDSLAGKLCEHSNIEELYLLNPRALLPCFVVICGAG